ncbi:MAG: hypothetical protein HFF02_09085, partial [Erysipelotrichaceae bacterium]|nr:hypothetical protein [Erysipelotrichaceae bacterium]
MKQLWKRLMILLICFVFVFVAWIVSDDIMDTLSANTKAASIYNIGDTVVFGKESFTYIGDDGSNLLLLGETSIGDNKTWNDANTIANNYRNSFGNIGKTVSVSSLAGTSDLLLAGTTGIDSSGVTVMDALDASIPSLNGNWWLKDSDLSSKNLARFLSGNNRRDGYQSYQKYSNPIGMTCQSPTSTRTESGTAFTQAFNEGGGVIASYPKTGTMTMTMDIKSVPKALGKYTTSNCASGTLLDSSPGISVGTISRTASFSRNSSNKLTIEGAPVHIFPFAMSSNLVGLDFKDWSSNIVTIGAGQCINLCSSSNSSGVILNPKIDGTKICGLKTAKDADLVVKLDIWSLNITAYNTISCPAVSTPAMTMSTRPLMKLPLDKILTYHNAKPTYSLSTSIDGSFPVSDTSGTRPYLTMMSDAMNVSLDSTNNGVKGTILSLKYPTSGTLIDLPLSFSGAKEGSRYLAASATDINGNEVYSVLDMVTADKQSISIDYQNLLKDGENSFQLTLYVLDDGIGDTSYRSTGTTITVRLKDEQTIDFDSIKNKATVEYGSDLELYANLTSDLNKQSTSDLVFSIPTDSRGKYQIIQQSYDRATGVAKVKIRPLTANVNA